MTLVLDYGLCSLCMGKTAPEDKQQQLAERSAGINQTYPSNNNTDHSITHLYICNEQAG